MPSHTAANALIQLYFADGHSGAPWIWQQWQEITGIKHGLFPSDDRLLPSGWSRQDSDDILAYFHHYNVLDSEDSRKKFAAGSRPGAIFPGREKWNAYVKKMWEKWKIHDRIVTTFREHHMHPITLLVDEGSLDQWPNADTYIQMALDGIASSLFGMEAFCGKELLPMKFRKSLTIFAQRSWTRIRGQFRTDRGRLASLENAAIKAFHGKFGLVAVADTYH
jgi:hypothetical protein